MSRLNCWKAGIRMHRGVEHTPRTRTKLFLDRVFRINMGVYVPLYLLDSYQ